MKTLTSRTPFVALVADFFAIDVLDFAQELTTCCPTFTSLHQQRSSWYFYVPKFDRKTSCEYRDLPEPIEIPGSVPIHGRDLNNLAQDRSSQHYKLFMHHVHFLEIDTSPIRALKEERRGYSPVYPIGPIVQTGIGSGDDAANSGGTVSQEQITELELAYGLELSNHKFLWVVRAPSSLASSAYLGAQNDVDPLQFLSSGFLERTKEQGMVIPSWAPQVQVLSHSSVGGFLTQVAGIRPLRVC
ncbi:Hydroquinone glucosyltransferase, partial [Mucuna pruriens]